MWEVVITPVLMKLHNEMSIANKNVSFYVFVSYENLLRKLHGLAFVWCHMYETHGRFLLLVYLKRNVISLRRHLLSSFYNTCNNVLRPVVLFSKSILRHYMTCCHWQRPRTESLSTNYIIFMFSYEIFNECETILMNGKPQGIT